MEYISAIKTYLKEHKKIVKFGLIGIGAIILIIVGVIVYRAIFGFNYSYDRLEVLMETAAKSYYRKNELPQEEGGEASVSLNTLIQEEYLKPLDKLTNDTTCTGEVKVKKNGKYYLYTPYLSCSTNYQTKSLVEVITAEENIVTEGNGLYQIEDEYVFRGEYVNNYVKFVGTTWRIIKIDSNGNIKLIKEDPESNLYYWDNRYNLEAERPYGINEYEVSRMHETIVDLYDNAKMFRKGKDVERIHMMAVPTCVAKRMPDNLALHEDQECSETYNKDFFTLISPVDLMRASIDEECTQLDSKTCRNYNYLANIIGSTWTNTVSGENTYEVYFVTRESVVTANANERKNIQLVVYFSGNELYEDGSGTLSDPYVLR